MKIIQPSFSIIDQDFGIDGIFRQIELAGRTCYRSEDKITETSAKVFVERMIASGHTAMLEHGTVYLMMPLVSLSKEEVWERYMNNKYSKCCVVPKETNLAELMNKSTEDESDFVYVTTNYRVLVENGWLDDLRYSCNPTQFHKRRVTVKFICDRGVSHEFVRHRVFSFAQESTRYCNYSKDKFGNEITFVRPCWLNVTEGSYTFKSVFQNRSQGYLTDAAYYFMQSILCAEESYFKLLADDLKPQEARAVLPNALKTELVMTGFTEDWKHFFDLRALGTTGKPHPDASCLAIPLYNEFKKRGLL
ncbi:MAG: FAD-dependent thymidylate synthase [Phocaeicola sp.]